MFWPKIDQTDRSNQQYASKDCSRIMSCPRIKDWFFVKRIGWYLGGRPRAVLTFKWQDPVSSITTYSDSRWARCKDTRKSTSGVCFMMCSHFIKSYSKTQFNIALPLYAFVGAASESSGLESMLRDYGV